jgi:hypothetical protein
VVEDTLNPEWDAQFKLPLVAAPVVNVLRIEVYDHDDSLLDSTPEFHGMVVLEGEGADALPSQWCSYPLCKKRRASDDRVLHGGEYERFNACVGGKLVIRFHTAEVRRPPHSSTRGDD